MIGVCLKYNQRNYGSQLQARATVKILEDLGLDYRIIQYNKKGIWFKLKNLYRIFNPVFINDRIQDIYKKRSITKHPEIAQRNALYEQYARKYFGGKTVSIDYYDDLKAFAKKMSAVITCSDQLWSPAALGTNFYNLMFVPDEVNKISFASSFGVEQIPSYQIKATRRYLNRIEHISVRENKGAEIVKELTGRDVPVLMDPVFVYDKNEWEQIVPVEQVYEFPYILCYFLGNDPTPRKQAIRFAEEKGLKIVALKFQNSYLLEDENFGDICPFDVDPDKFLNIIRGAEYVLTDSFHGCAFSIICEKKFVIYNRYKDGSKISKNSRVDTVCTNLKLENRRAQLSRSLSEYIDENISYGEVKSILSLYIEKTKKYLINSFGLTV